MDRDAVDAYLQTLRAADLDLALSATIRRGTLTLPAKPPSGLDATAPTLATASANSNRTTALPLIYVGGGEAIESLDAELTLRRLLGEGGMGAVWLAHQRSLDRDVAVKRLRVGAATGSAVVALLVEGRATGALEHPSIVPVHALGVDAEGAPLLVMKRVDGATLDTLVREPEHPAWPPLEGRHGDRLTVLVEALMRVADALAFAHSRGIVHRDIKPENIMVGAFGEVYLLDWGVALRADAPDQTERDALSIVGTPVFMAPEMVRGCASEVDARTDVYLLGATLHAVVTGRPRHEGGTLHAVLRSALLSEPVAYGPEIAPDLAGLANRSTSADPAARPATAAAFRAELAGFLRHRASRALSDDARNRLRALGNPGALAPPSGENLATVAATRTLTECRFALRQALSDWPENATARQTLTTTIRWMIEAELHRRSPDAAAALLQELDAPNDELAASIEQMRTVLVEGRRLEAEARIEAHARDPRVAARERGWIASGLVAALLMIAAYAGLVQAGTGAAPPLGLHLALCLALLSVTAITVAALRRRVLANRMGRQAVAVLLIVLVATILADAIGLIRAQTADDVAPYTLLVAGAVLAGASVAQTGLTRWAAGAMAFGAVAAGVFRQFTVATVGAAMFLALALLGFEARRHVDSGRVP